MNLRHAAAALALLAAAPALAVERPSQLYVFGDSLVDAGNINIAVFGDRFNPRAAGYFSGQFSNGPNYTTLLSRNFYGASIRPLLGGGTNYAYGGARAVTNSDGVPDLASQLAPYTRASGGVADPNALYVINFGGNDVFAVGRGDTGGVPAGAYLQNVADTIAGSVITLQAAGARRFLVTGIPNVSATGFAAQSLLTGALDAIVLDPGTTLTRFDYQGFFIALGNDPAAFGVAPFTETGNCIGRRPVTNLGTDCTGFFSFDGVHPTAQVQDAIYRTILAQTGLAAVPEPAAWSLLIAGFGLVGTSMRKRRALAV